MTKNNYKYNLNENVVYVGSLYDKYTNEECVVTARSKAKKFYEWYRVRFCDGKEILTPAGTLKRKDDVVD